ncbi:MAG TPA: hypothetical protein DCS67_12580 [Clostridiales bacterium UBA8960]|nr:hypothetical protein [Clostridiales bacterium UBA8960]
MFRKGLVLLVMIFMISAHIGFSATEHPVSADQIIIAEPTTEKITNDKQVIVNVNITNVKVTDNPIIMSLVRIANRLPFADSLGSELNVSVMKLSSNAASDMSRSTIYNMTYSTEDPVYSANYQKETQVINRYFELKDMILAHNYEISTINRSYRFDLIANNISEIAKLNADTLNQYNRWTQLKSNVSELRKEYTQVQTQYIKYFEKNLLVDEIKTLSYFKVIGRLPNGTYKLRFIDLEGQLIKEFAFEVIDKEETIRLIESFNTRTN